MPPPAAGASRRERRPTSDPGRGWASLPEDLVRLFASRLLAGDFLDYVRFRTVCTSWRSGTDSPRGRGVTDPRFHPRRWMMLPEGHCLYPGHPDLDGCARFLNLDTGTLVRVRVPLLGDHCAIDSVDGLLLLLGDQYQEGAVRLLHPFTGDIAELPPLAPLYPQLARLLPNCPDPYKIKNLTRVVSASASFSAGVITIMLGLHEVRRVAFATFLDRQWTLSSWEYPISDPPLSFQGKLYMVHIHQIFQIDPPVQDGASSGCGLQPPRLIATIPESKLLSLRPICLVECDSDILVLGSNDLSMSQILVCKLADLVLQRFVVMKSIGDNTLFVRERSISVSSKVLPTVMGDNVVYLIRSRRPYLAQYHLSSGTLSPAIDDCSLYGCAPGPSSLIHYIFSCCARDQWNRGRVFRLKPQCSQCEANNSDLPPRCHHEN